MKRMRIMGVAIVAVFAMSAVFASGAFATLHLTLKTAGKGKLPAGSVILASSPTLTFTTSAGKLECTTNEIEGITKTNGAATDKGTVEESGVRDFGEEAEPAKLCRTTTPLGPTEIHTHNFPWLIEFKTVCALSTKCTAGVTGENIVKSVNATVKKVEFESTFPGAGGAKCFFQSAKPVSTFELNTADVDLLTKEQTFKLEKVKSNAACPKEGKLNGEWEVTSGGETLEAESK